ncbi:MAG: aminopeptidase P family protein [Oscillospiraceae bacterium]|nr:aminopeptidase P family protein [Oscillospiraceae bacterium]
MTRLEKLLNRLDGCECDAFLLTSKANRQYASSAPIAEGMALISRRGCRYFTDSRYLEAAQRSVRGFEILDVTREHPYPARIEDAVRDWGVKMIGFEDGHLTAAELKKLEEKLSAKLIPAQQEISAPRETKDPDELAMLRKAQNIADAAYLQLLPKIQVGMTEKELQAELIYLLYRNGAEGLSFSPIVISGENTSLPHGVAGDKKLDYGDFVTMDFGCKLGGYCSDMTRTVALGFVTPEMRKVYDTVLAAQEAGMAATKAGVKCADADRAARIVIEDAGYGEYFGHSYGHSIGLEVHEKPNCSPSDESILREGVVCSAEPGIYLPGRFGVRIEDVVIVHADGCESITAAPKNLQIL